MKPIIVGNWKANVNFDVYKDLPSESKNIEICMAIPYIYIPQARELSKKNVSIAAQDCSRFGIGPHTGEIPAEFLKNFDVKYVLIGHSERRAESTENVETLTSKINKALGAGLRVIYCIGENSYDRENNQHMKTLYDQFFTVVGQNIQLDVAYEPIYSIGTGMLPKKDDVQEVIDHIKKWSRNINVKGRILYGGSIDANNIEDFEDVKGLDGFLIGGSSLTTNFIEIVKKFDSMKNFH